MRYDSGRKLKRNKDLYDYYLDHPEMSYREIGQVFEVSGPRAQQVVTNEKKRREILQNRVKR